MKTFWPGLSLRSDFPQVPSQSWSRGRKLLSTSLLLRYFRSNCTQMLACSVPPGNHRGRPDIFSLEIYKSDVRPSSSAHHHAHGSQVHSFPSEGALKLRDLAVPAISSQFGIKLIHSFFCLHHHQRQTVRPKLPPPAQPGLLSVIIPAAAALIGAPVSGLCCR